jgi:hypothetical protein
MVFALYRLPILGINQKEGTMKCITKWVLALEVT